MNHDKDKVLAVFQIGLHANANFYNREVYNLFEWFGDIGGFQGILLVLSATISSFFSSILASVQKAESIYKYIPDRKPQE